MYLSERQVRTKFDFSKKRRNKDDEDQYFPVNQSSTTPREYRYYIVATVSNSDTAASRVERGRHAPFSLYKYTHTEKFNLGCSGSDEDALVIRQRRGGLYIT